MILETPSTALRPLRSEHLSADLVIVGGGLAGTCAAIAAARSGIKVVLVQDRPVLGGNSSSEVRLWALGATSHMNNNNRWSREGGLVDELLVENLYRNPEGNTILWDMLLLEKVRAESNITLLLNTAIDSVVKDGAHRVAEVSGFCSQNQLRYHLRAPLFCDASGDGIVGFQAGAAFRMGAEKAEEFGEGFAPDLSYGELLGHTIYFYSKDTGKPVTYVAPAFALQDITEIPRFRRIRTGEHGCKFWWIEYGGRRDTIHETEDIKWELWRIVYGVWNHIKNSGEFPDAANLTLEWVGTIPGKRESRRFEGDYLLCQQDVIEQRFQADAVAAGGWSLDLHPADAVYSNRPACNQYHSKGVYPIPYRCYYSRNIENLFLAGRVISASHVAFGSTRVMLTCGHGGAAVGTAAAHCRRSDLNPRELLEPARMSALQGDLNRRGQAIPGIPSDHRGNLARSATISASSIFVLGELPTDGGWQPLDVPIAQMLPFEVGTCPRVRLRVRSRSAETLRVALRTSEKPFNYAPEEVLEEHSLGLQPGEQIAEFQLQATVPSARYAFICFYGSAGIEVATSSLRCSGLLSVERRPNPPEGSAQNPPPEVGVEAFDFWIPARRPGGKNLALQLSPPLSRMASIDYLLNGWERPRERSNAWIADPTDREPTLTLTWPEAVTFSSVLLYFDTDFDHAMETAQWGHPERIVPFCVRRGAIVDGEGRELAAFEDNHQTVRCFGFDQPVTTKELSIRLHHPGPDTPAALFGLRVES